MAMEFTGWKGKGSLFTWRVRKDYRARTSSLYAWIVRGIYGSEQTAAGWIG